MNQQDYREAIDGQKQWARDIADKIEAGATLNQDERDFAAATMRRHADNLKYSQPKTRGAPAILDPDEIMLLYIAMTLRGDKKEIDICEKLAEDHGVSPEAIKKCLGMVAESPPGRAKKVAATMAVLSGKTYSRR